MSANLVPATIFWCYQRGVSAADLKVGETVRMNLPGTDDMGRVESLSPLTLKFGGNATLSYGQDSKVKFERISKITATDVVAGQKGKVAGNVYPDGRIEAREVWVNVEPEKESHEKEELAITTSRKRERNFPFSFLFVCLNFGWAELLSHSKSRGDYRTSFYYGQKVVSRKRAFFQF